MLKALACCLLPAAVLAAGPVLASPDKVRLNCASIYEHLDRMGRLSLNMPIHGPGAEGKVFRIRSSGSRRWPLLRDELERSWRRGRLTYQDRKRRGTGRVLLKTGQRRQGNLRGNPGISPRLHEVRAPRWATEKYWHRQKPRICGAEYIERCEISRP